MNKNLNLCEILKDCPKGTILYSPLAGVVKLKNIDCHAEYPIKVYYNYGSEEFSFTKDGLFYSNAHGECLLWPSKEVRTWDNFKPKKPKFDPKTLNPFDKVLVRDSDDDSWCCDLFSHIKEENIDYKYVASSFFCYRCCIPYNEETKHLVGTDKEAPEYYRYWED